MNSGSEPPDRGGIAAQTARMVDGFGRLVREHVALARLELADEAREVGREAAAIAVFVPFLLVGYGLLWVGVAFALGRWLGTEWGFVVSGVVNLAVGAAGVARAAGRLRRRGRPLENSTRELRNSAAALAGGLPASTGKEMERAQR